MNHFKSLKLFFTQCAPVSLFIIYVYALRHFKLLLDPYFNYPHGELYRAVITIGLPVFIYHITYALWHGHAKPSKKRINQN